MQGSIIKRTAGDMMKEWRNRREVSLSLRLVWYAGLITVVPFLLFFAGSVLVTAMKDYYEDNKGDIVR